MTPPGGSGTTRLTDEELCRYLDGELAEDEVRRVEDRLAASDEARRKLEALRELGEAVRARYERAADEAAPELDALWARLARRLEEEPGRAAARRGEARADRPARDAGGLAAWLRGLFAGPRGYLATAAVAAAAGVLVTLAVQPPREVTRIVHLSPAGPAQAAERLAAAAPRAEAAEVETLEVTGGTGTIFQIPADEGGDGDVATTVIWITPDTDGKAGPEGPI